MEPGQQPLCVSLRGPGESVPAPVLPRDTFGQSCSGTFPSRPRGPYRSPPSTSSRSAAKGTEIQSRRILLPLKKRSHPQSSLRFLTPAQRRRVQTLLLSPSVKSARPASPPPPRARPCPCRHAGLPQPGGRGAHRGAVGGPGDEEPLVALGVLAVQAVQHVARLLLVQQGQHEGVVVGIPAPGQLFVGSQHELFWKEKTEKVALAEGKAQHTLQHREAARLRACCSSSADNDAILQKNKLRS